tara:strand:- start:13774 stop:14337 length:564 start_codon:yes stop_codon:yes gene_type:complete
LGSAGVAETLGPAVRGLSVCAVSSGSFGLIEVIEYLVNAAPGADVSVSVWSSGGADLSQAFRMIQSGLVKRCRWIVDPSFAVRAPELCALLVEFFGAESIRTASTHKKVVMVRNDRLAFCVRASMNLQAERQLEVLDVTESPKVCDWYGRQFDEEFAAGAPADVDGADYFSDAVFAKDLRRAGLRFS